jgi:GMP synthase (glutamine-hydrolysing)
LPDPAILGLGIPILGICYGLQLFGKLLGGKVAPSPHREYGHGTLTIDADRHPSPLFAGLPATLRVWNSHGDRLTKLPPGFTTTARTENSEHAAIEDTTRRLYALQFHPEVHHTPRGAAILRNFIHRVCRLKKNWTTADHIANALATIRAQAGGQRVLLALSGGVDSSVAAALLHKAIGRHLTCVYVDTGLMRQDETRNIVQLYAKHFRIDLRVVDASKLFLARLKNITDPERKRKIIGATFIEIFEKKARELKTKEHIGHLAQGTIYPDVIESVAIGGNPAALIKTHHNVGGLPARMKFKLIEPLRQLFKDEVRQVGAKLGLPREVVWRQPFPGPGLAIRIIGEVTQQRLDTLRRADAILHEEMHAANLYYKIWQTFCVYLPLKTVGVVGDERTYADIIALRLVHSTDAMTAHWAALPHALLQKISTRITNEVPGISRVVLDISNKPPATIEWE